jgi:hypothetical protein
MVNPKTPSKQSITVSIMHKTPPSGPRPTKRTAHNLSPNINILSGIGHKSRTPTRTGGPMDADDLVLINSPQPSRIVVPKIPFGHHG